MSFKTSPIWSSGYETPQQRKNARERAEFYRQIQLDKEAKMNQIYVPPKSSQADKYIEKIIDENKILKEQTAKFIADKKQFETEREAFYRERNKFMIENKPFLDIVAERKYVDDLYAQLKKIEETNYSKYV